MLEKINKLTNRQVAAILAVVGALCFFSGLANPFQGDDTYQIVNNIPVHSITHLFLFFQSSTFYNGQRLIGVYYRPLMSTVFSLLYSIFGPHTWAFHVFQTSVYIASAFIVYLVLKRFFKPVLALSLALIFLVHPLNSQVVYAIPSMQDALFFFFGILALWILATFNSIRSLWAATGCLLLSLFSKETAIVFVVLSLFYLFWFKRKQLVTFSGIVIVPVVIYITLKINAVGVNAAQHGAPIDNLHLAGRLMTAPSILLFYLTKFIFPWKLASGYYWVYPTFSIRHVLIPLLIDLVVIGLFCYGGVRVRAKLSKKQYYGYLFFAVWTAIGILPYMQLIPLDMTACETWFYCSMVGLLGMIGMIGLTFRKRFQPKDALVVVAVLIAVLGVRTALRGPDYRSQYILAVHDNSVSQNDYSAMNNIAEGLISKGQYTSAASYAERSAAIYPTVSNYDNLGVALEDAGEYSAAIAAYNKALDYGSLSITYENLGAIYLAYGNASTNNNFYATALKAYPEDFKLWVYLAILADAEGDNGGAKTALSSAEHFGSVPPTLYNDIMNNQSFSLNILGRTLVIHNS